MKKGKNGSWPSYTDCWTVEMACGHLHGRYKNEVFFLLDNATSTANPF